MQRCALCYDQKEKLEGDGRLGFDFTPEELCRSVSLGRCDSCLVILEGLRQSELGRWSFDHDVRRVYARCLVRRGGFQDTLRLEIYFEDERPKVELEFYSLLPHAFRAILPRTVASGQPGSPEGLRWIRSALKDCTQNHMSCRSATQRLLPKRVIALSTAGSGTVTVSLQEPMNQLGEYVALSHCWGKQQVCTTTKDNLSSHKEEIQWSKLPKTFQEAISLALALGFQYIWIDSLCIIQDDKADWETESARMWTIYQDAVLTLAATSSAGDNEGCGFDYDRQKDQELQLPQCLSTQRIGVRRPHKHFTADADTAQKMAVFFPLLTRGWAFQERLLSPRFLHITQSECVWECRESSYCECGGLGQPSSPAEDHYQEIQRNDDEGFILGFALKECDERETRPVSDAKQTRHIVVDPQFSHDDEGTCETPSSLSLHGKRAPLNLNSAETSIEPPPYGVYDGSGGVKLPESRGLVNYFHRVVETYSSLALSRSSDRLPALSGLCKRIQHLRGYYIAGLWSDSICHDLLWRVQTITLTVPTNGARAIENRGPTWSWISVDSPARYWDDITSFNIRDGLTTYMTYFRTGKYIAAGQNIEGMSISVTVPGQNPFGGVTSALITIQCSSVRATLCYVFESWEGTTGATDPAVFQLELIRGKYRIPFWADYSLSAEGASRVPHESILTLALIHPEVCLVLRPLSDIEVARTEEMRWERVGIARISQDLLTRYRVNWMHASSVDIFTIV